MALIRSHAIRQLCCRHVQLREMPSLFERFQSYSNRGMMGGGYWNFLNLSETGIRCCTLVAYSCNKDYGHSFENGRGAQLLHSSTVPNLSVLDNKRLMSTLVKAPPQARQMGALKVSLMSPGIVYEPYAPREPISFLRRWLTRSGWRRTKEDIIMELKNAYAIAKLRRATGYSKNKFYEEAVQLYRQINVLMAVGDKTSLRKAVTENMYSILKNEIKQRESSWSSVYWELVEPIVKIRTLRARMIGIDKNDLKKAFIQLTIEFLSKQKFEAYDSNGNIVAGDKTKEIKDGEDVEYLSGIFKIDEYYLLTSRALV